MEDIPSEVSAIVDGLEESQKETVLGYIVKLRTTIEEKEKELSSLKQEHDHTREAPTFSSVDSADTGAEEAGMDGNRKMDQDDDDKNDEEPFPPLYEQGEDYDKASECKQAAADLKGSGDWQGALLQYTEAVLAAPPSALLYANRAICLLELNRPKAAVRDSNVALAENPDSAKALRARGKARKLLGDYEGALVDISASQTIDFDPEMVTDLKFLTEKRTELERMQAAERIQKEEKMKLRASEIKKAQEQAAKSARASSSSTRASGSGMPGGGMPGMPPNMADIMSDPEIVAAMQNPKVLAAMQDLMSGPGGPMAAISNPQKFQSLMQDPEVGPVLQKIMTKFMGGGGMPSQSHSHSEHCHHEGAASDDMDIPDLGDVPDLD